MHLQFKGPWGNTTCLLKSCSDSWMSATQIRECIQINLLGRFAHVLISLECISIKVGSEVGWDWTPGQSAYSNFKGS